MLTLPSILQVDTACDILGGTGVEADVTDIGVEFYPGNNIANAVDLLP